MRAPFHRHSDSVGDVSLSLPPYDHIARFLDTPFALVFSSHAFCTCASGKKSNILWSHLLHLRFRKEKRFITFLNYYILLEAPCMKII